MKVAVVYNRESKSVINLFGTPNREKYGLKAIKRILDSLKKGGYQAIAMEGDKDLIDKLENFMPRAMKGERPGMVFNLSYGIQGQARYTHVPGILEMVGVPYVGSGPLAHSLALDKVVAKMIFRQNGIPTPDFAVLDGPGFPIPKLTYPLIVKPKNEAVSMGLKIVHDKQELEEAADIIFKKFDQQVLAEQYIDGPEINVGILGNNPPEAFTPAQLIFDDKGPPIYSYEDKTHRSGREVTVACPARVSKEIQEKAQKIAVQAFRSLGCYDCARMDMRLDHKGNIYVLEVNSLPSLGEHGSYVHAAEQMGMDFPALVCRLIEVASARYFGTPTPPPVSVANQSPGTLVFDYLTGRRDQIERRLQEWTNITSRSSDQIGLQMAQQKLDTFFTDMGMSIAKEHTDNRHVWVWQTKKKMENGILLVGHLDVPLDPTVSVPQFRRDPELLYGEGIGTSRAPLVSMQFALRALRAHKLLRRVPLGVLYYTDEGNDCRMSTETIQRAMASAKQVLVLRPGNEGDFVVTERRGQKKFRLLVEGKPRRLGKVLKRPEPLQWLFSVMGKINGLTSRKERIAVSAVNISVEAYPMLLPHKVQVDLLLSYPDDVTANRVEGEIREILGKHDIKWKLDLVSHRPPMNKRRSSISLSKKLETIASDWEIPLENESSIWPSVAGLAPKSTAVLCGVGPVALGLYTSQEAVKRISLIQRTLLLAEFLAREIPQK